MKYVINHFSVAGHSVILRSMDTGMYSPSKFALTSIIRTLRLELIRLESRIKITVLKQAILFRIREFSCIPETLILSSDEKDRVFSYKFNKLITFVSNVFLLLLDFSTLP